VCSPTHTTGVNEKCVVQHTLTHAGARGTHTHTLTKPTNQPTLNWDMVCDSGSNHHHKQIQDDDCHWSLPLISQNFLVRLAVLSWLPHPPALTIF